MNTPLDPDNEIRCAEYALGVLDATERRAFEDALARDPAMRAELERWQQRLVPLAEDVPEIGAPPRVWTRIQRDLGLMGGTAAVAAAAPAAAARRGWWDNLALWRWVGMGASVAAVTLLAVSLGVLRVTPQVATATDAYMAAAIARSDGIVHWTVTVDLRRARMVLVPAAPATVATDRSTELWLIPPGAKPISLGVFTPDAPATVTLPPQIAAQLSDKAALAVSIEPRGGSPTGQPTGPVVATGPMRGT
ncbi:anti-sigma-K factor RskA [Pandoraea terrae]|uniref:Regulator of SigK n=1 Tax=Pandoraea terrae TaxID=1537710 RepID=A0A5E4XS65_9BURK|nr:anti-sigma factor [Pandoraea terrae]VVE39291.1 anti-sigma-K factor RskA [Pandoraea terrae]